ncbi:hypothetical protein KFL_007940070 [Klebsormidium nitens]|uniref:Uncharacterized protein n=1 Tax=Klebsormidium nitens TaxID=105231 RepID=A0A1Y1IPS1_KLENI|nr:hypothetical protein KFL_007940070 [Klebsormidium nitens]|eukprot:GAQ91489.1 hypothetical protein KFL_007940070 [Klebsormidium nitens]
MIAPEIPDQEEAPGTAQEQKVEDNAEHGRELRTGLGTAAASPVQLDDEAAAPAKTPTGPNAALLPFINASKAAAKRQRALEKGSVIGKDTAFLKLQEAHDKLLEKYNALKVK